MRSHAKDVDAYIAEAPDEVQSKLQEVRRAIRKVAPGATESIGYGIPVYSYRGALAWFGLQKKHIGLYLRPPTIAEHRRELKGYTTTKSAVHLPLDKPVPIALVQKLVKARKRRNESGE